MFYYFDVSSGCFTHLSPCVTKLFVTLIVYNDVMTLLLMFDSLVVLVFFDSSFEIFIYFDFCALCVESCKTLHIIVLIL